MCHLLRLVDRDQYLRKSEGNRPVLLNKSALPVAALLFCFACSQYSADEIEIKKQTNPNAPEVYKCEIDQFAFSVAPSTIDFYPIEDRNWVVAFNTCEGIAEKSKAECLLALSEAEKNSEDTFYLSSGKRGPLADRSGVAYLGDRHYNFGDNNDILFRLDTKRNVLGFGGEISALSSNISIDPSKYEGFSGGGKCVRSFSP